MYVNDQSLFKGELPANNLCWRYFNNSVMMISNKNIFKLFNWYLSQQTSHSFMNDLKEEALKIYMYWLQEGMQLCIEVYIASMLNIMLQV